MNTEKIKKILREKGWSVSKLARMAGLPEATVRSIVTKEDANPTLRHLKAISKALGVTIDEIVK